MAEPLLMTAANGHNEITFEDYETVKWYSAVEWLKHEGFAECGDKVLELDEEILPSFVKQGVTIAAGFDNWSGNYLLAECDMGDEVILKIANYIAAVDRRPAG